MKTQGEIESAISESMGRFQQEYMGRGPKDVRAHVIDDLVVVRLKGVLTAAEQHLVMTLPGEKGRDLLKQVHSRHSRDGVSDGEHGKRPRLLGKLECPRAKVTRNSMLRQFLRHVIRLVA